MTSIKSRKYIKSLLGHENKITPTIEITRGATKKTTIYCKTTTNGRKSSDEYNTGHGEWIAIQCGSEYDIYLHLRNIPSQLQIYHEIF